MKELLREQTIFRIYMRDLSFPSFPSFLASREAGRGGGVGVGRNKNETKNKQKQKQKTGRGVTLVAIDPPDRSILPRLQLN